MTLKLFAISYRILGNKVRSVIWFIELFTERSIQ